jgi:hypothetical protein
MNDKGLINALLLLADDKSVSEVGFGNFGGCIQEMVGVTNNQLKKARINAES